MAARPFSSSRRIFKRTHRHAGITAHGRTEASLWDNEARFQLADSVLSAVQNVVLVVNNRGEIVFASPSVSRVFGYAPQEVLGAGWVNLLKRDEAERQSLKHYWVGAATGKAAISPTPYESAEYDKQGKQRWMLWQDTKGPGNSLILIGSDITARKQGEEGLRYNEARYRSLALATAQIVWTTDPQGQVVEDLPVWRAFTGQRQEEVVGAGWTAALHPEDRQLVRAAWTEAVATGNLYTAVWRVRHVDGDYHYFGVRAVPVRDRSGQVCEWIGTCSDISARKQAEEALRESEDRYRSFFEHASDGIACFTDEGILMSVNQELTVLLGWSREEFIGQHYSQFVTPLFRTRLEERMRRLRAGEPVPTNYEVEAVHKNGQRVLLEGRTRLIRAADGHSLGVLGIYRDITERKRMEDLLQQAKEAAEAADREKSEFLATMSHELRTPLGIILGYTEMLLEDAFAGSRAEQLGALQGIDRNARELFELITAVLDLSRLEAGRLPSVWQETQVTTLLQELQTATQALQKRAGLTFVWEVEPALPTLYTDLGKLKIILKNLIGNALKFTKAGSITVSVQLAQQGVAFHVTDTGIGIPQEALATIFEPFRQVEHGATHQYGGTGLGLHIVKRLLEALGGTITVESEVGRGSTFCVWVPLGMRREEPQDQEGSKMLGIAEQPNKELA